MKDDCDPDHEKDLIIVGIGASAGGLEALQELLRELPESKNTAYVIAQHISPTHKSMMVDILQKSTGMAVSEPRNGDGILPATIYITPPNKNIFIRDGAFELKEPGAEVILPKPSIDLFFTSLANQLGDRAVGIILSGTGTDGRLGMGAIKAAGGITLAQEPKTAKYDSMPLASIDQQLVDIVSTPREMGEELKDIFAWMTGELKTRPSQAPQSDLMIILGMVKQFSGVDFSHYKTNTVFRRIKRRMLVRRCQDTKQYIDCLHDTADEVGSLYKDLLIGVTAFFRNPESFEKLRVALEENAEKDLDPPERVRGWVVGCSTGEEAYSIAIVLCELFDSSKTKFSIFATDIDADSIQVARAGKYPASALKDVPQELIEKYFEQDGNGYRVRKFVRDSILFSIHDVTRDPPFGKIDILSCRNLLIYFNTDLQRRVLRSLTFALKVGGHLFLGASETLSDYQDAYANVFREQKVFRKILAPDFKTQFYAGAGLSARGAMLDENVKPATGRRPEELLHEMLLTTVGDHFLPLSVIVNESHTVIYARQKNPYLSLPAGASNLVITKMVPQELELDLRTTIHAAAKSGGAHFSRFIKVELADARERLVRMVAMPIAARHEGSRLMVVCFQEEDPSNLGIVLEHTAYEEVDSTESGRLALELERTKEQLQSVIEELETSNEELQATNEELQSTNEELQSTNEELETANEELQSTNEEVQVAYNELQVVSDENKAQRDIAEAMTREREEQRELLEGISQSSLNGIMAFAAIRDETTREIVDFEWTFVNRSAARMVQREADQLIGKRLLDEMPGNREEGLFDIYRDVVNSRDTVHREFSYEHESLNHWFEQIVVPFRDGFVVTFADITERKTAEDDLMMHETRLRLATESADIGVWSWDFASGRVECNEIMLAQLGLIGGRADVSVDEWVGRAVPEDREALMASLHQTKDSGTELEMIYRVSFEEVEEHFSLRGRLVSGVSGKGLRLVGTNMNASELQHQKAALARLRSIVQHSARVKDEFMANVSHEMRTPIHGIMGSAQLLEAGELGDDQKHHVDNIISSSNNLSRIIDDVLDFSKLDAGKVKLEAIEFDLVDVIRDSMETVETQAGRKGVSLDWNTSEDVRTQLIGDGFRLSQVLVNLLANAVKFSDEGGEVTLDVDTNTGEGGCNLHFSVSDTGIGMSQETIESLFSPFKQADSTMTRRFGGTGLGLTISADLVSMMGGKIWVESELDKGSVFHFTARLGEAEKAGPVIRKPTNRPVSDYLDIDAILDGCRVLVVEDDFLNATVANELLRAKSVITEHADNGVKALELLKDSAPFDVVLMDCQMPIMDGYEASRQIRKWNRFKDLPVIALTANAFEDDRKKAMEAGMNDFLAKPFEKEKLYDIIARWVARD